MKEINSIKELKSLLSPALKYRVKLLEKVNIFVTEDELFRYFANKRWQSSKNLHLCEIVDDVINLEISNKEVF